MHIAGHTEDKQSTPEQCGAYAEQLYSQMNPGDKAFPLTGGDGTAAGFITQAERAGLQVQTNTNTLPPVGSMIIWSSTTGEKDGHAGIVTGVSNGVMTVKDSNFFEDGKQGSFQISASDPNFYTNPSSGQADYYAFEGYVLPTPP